MQKMAQEWFTQSVSDGADVSEKPSSSLLADWNSYAASHSDENSSLPLGFDLEAAVRSANDTVSGTFSVVSKGVRDIPGNLQSATSSVPSGKALMYFGLFLATGVFFVFLAFTMFLPVMVIMPQKFAICFTLGCGFIIGSFFALKGPKNQLAHMSSKERLPFTLGFLGSMVGTIYVSMVLHSYILSVLFSVIQVLALAYYAFSYFPGGSAGLKFLSSTLTSTVLKCFGR
ncbi:Protein transport protein SFT2 [Morus notabilis]|uniref:Vesicle transport protein n=1 Tax=Morus notabilis TaxID=981085 RepID=W9RMJ7_9ROSA|nr:protein transport protein SFT2 [Morus notabilis]EXB97665.1 Protein transport protein SFT2 [Morus notabilis]